MVERLSIEVNEGRAPQNEESTNSFKSRFLDTVEGFVLGLAIGAN